MITISPITALNDNYIWTIVHPAMSRAVIVDPGEAKPVIAALEQQQLELCGILLTHHHWDHTGGVSDLVQNNNIPVYGPSSIDLVTHPVNEKEPLAIAAIDYRLQVITIPGHTLDHIAYYNDHALFCGDTLFTGGCGRVFEGTHRQMYHSLQKLATLTSSTLVYCGHEYTQANLTFAKIVEPDNADIANRLHRVEVLRAANKPTVPSRLADEFATNPFLRCDQATVQQAASRYCGRQLNTAIEVFAEVRQWKDQAKLKICSN